ncbi:PhzF family phenazine biosynthesis protein [Roseibium sp.]|uniref:PhzF family phenazine biosynthesis protein n=1 Tax=Roseibium sp. TaxID=1936156 RepID=UPI003A9769F9
MTQAQKNITTRVVSSFIPSTHAAGSNSAQGNPAGVVLDADGLTDGEMLEIAAKIGLSETAFVSASRTEGFKLDFFTPTRRIAHCGHATIAAFSILADLGKVEDGLTSKETVDGPRKIIIRNGEAFMEQLAPRYETSEAWSARNVSTADVLNSLGLAEADLAPGAAPIVVNTGNRFMIIGVNSTAALRGLQPDQQAIESISEALDLIGYYVFTQGDAAAGHDAATRMFAPRYGIEEESGTGMAAGPLACFLHDKLGMEKAEFLISQGAFMTPSSPSEIKVSLDLDAGGAIGGLMAGGRGRVSEERVISI